MVGVRGVLEGGLAIWLAGDGWVLGRSLYMCVRARTRGVWCVGAVREPPLRVLCGRPLRVLGGWLLWIFGRCGWWLLCGRCVGWVVGARNRVVNALWCIESISCGFVYSGT